jgi:enterobacterial common antigen flippase
MSEHSYSRIVKSSSVVGGAQFVNMLIGMVRIKFVAVLIGPAGFGLLNLYQSIIQMVSTIAGLGLKTSAVREIAQGFADGDQDAVACSVLSLRRMCWLSGVCGAGAIVVFSRQLSEFTFGDTSHFMRISFAGIAVFLVNLQAGQMAVVQGARRIGDLAKINVFGATIGSVFGIGLYYWLGVDGIVPAIITLASIQLAVSYFFARKVVLPTVGMTWIQSFKHAGGMLRLGIVFMWNGLLAALVIYFTRIIIGHAIDLEAVGIYAAAFALSGMVVNFVLDAMGADYLPALSAVASDHRKMRELANQQTEVGLLLALPGLLVTLAFAPWVIQLFYSAEFTQAGDLLRWFVLGCLGRVITWPMGFILVAKGMGKALVVTETLANALHVALILLGLHFCGLVGTAIAFFALYIAHGIWLLVLTRLCAEFYWSRSVVRLLALILPLVVATFLLQVWLHSLPALAFGAIVTACSGVFCLRGLAMRLGSEHKVCRIAARIPVLKNIILSDGAC